MEQAAHMDDDCQLALEHVANSPESRASASQQRHHQGPREPGNPPRHPLGMAGWLVQRFTKHPAERCRVRCSSCSSWGPGFVQQAPSNGVCRVKTLERSPYHAGRSGWPAHEVAVECMHWGIVVDPLWLGRRWVSSWVPYLLCQPCRAAQPTASTQAVEPRPAELLAAQETTKAVRHRACPLVISLLSRQHLRSAFAHPLSLVINTSRVSLPRHCCFL